MSAPIFEAYQPPTDCPCAGCVEHRRTQPHRAPLRAGGHPAAHGVRRAAVWVAAAGAVLGGTGQEAVAADRAAGRAPADEPAAALWGAAGEPLRPAVGELLTVGEPVASAADALVRDGEAAESAVDARAGADMPQGDPGPPSRGVGSGVGVGVYVDTERPPGPFAAAVAPRTSTRAEILERAQRWVDLRMPYSMDDYAADGYRQDCSGFIAMAWNLGSNQWTGSLPVFAERISRDELRPGDMLLFHDPASATESHVTLFGGWLDDAESQYLAYEQTRPHTIKRATPYAYWNNSSKYLAYRYRGVREGGSQGTPGRAQQGRAFPGSRYFRPGRSNAHVTRLGRQLVRKGFDRHYARGPGRRWSESDRRNVEAFQRAQGWRGADANGYPSPETWRRLFS